MLDHQQPGGKPLEEGVETEAQRTLLALMGCPIGQGYLFGAPTDVESFASALGQASEPLAA